MPNEVSQTEKDKYCVISLHGESKQNKTKLLDTENRSVVATREGSWGVGEMGEGAQDYKLPVTK